MHAPHLLVVDDDLLLLSSVRRVLAHKLTVHTATSAAEAGAVFQAADHLDAVVVGSSLGHEGREVLRRARTLQPDARRVVTTGRGGHRLCQTLDAAIVLIEASEAATTRAAAAG